METLECFKLLANQKNEILEHKIEYIKKQCEIIGTIVSAIEDNFGAVSPQMDTLFLATQPFINHLFDELRESETARRGNTHD